MNAKYNLFFVFSIGTASDQATKVIASLSNYGTIRKKVMYSIYIQERKIWLEE